MGVRGVSILDPIAAGWTRATFAAGASVNNVIAVAPFNARSYLNKSPIASRFNQGRLLVQVTGGGLLNYSNARIRNYPRLEDGIFPGLARGETWIALDGLAPAGAVPESWISVPFFLWPLNTLQLLLDCMNPGLVAVTVAFRWAVYGEFDVTRGDS